MILVDSRAGSCELIAPLRHAGLPVQEDTLDFGDIAFMGRGEKGSPLFIGIEHKKLPDLVQSLNSDRLAGHQLVGMVDTYDRPYLLIEGEWESDAAGRVIVRKWGPNRDGVPWRTPAPLKGAPPAVELEKRVLTLETRGGLRVRWTPDQQATVRYLTALYRFWTDKDLDGHKSHLAIHAPDFDNTLKRPVSSFRKGLHGACPGVGLALTSAVETAVWDAENNRASWRKLMLMTEQQLADLPLVDSKGKSRRLGPAKAKQIMEALR